MPKHTISIEIKLHSGEEWRGDLHREYALEDLTKIPDVFAHAGKTAALHFEGVEKLDMTE